MLMAGDLGAAKEDGGLWWEGEPSGLPDRSPRSDRRPQGNAHDFLVAWR